VAFVDDDVVVDPSWPASLMSAFMEEPQAVVLPARLWPRS
jgi:GT2 family glycosyltransferase